MALFDINNEGWAIPTLLESRLKGGEISL